MNMKMKPKATVVRVTANEFELSDGRVFQHPCPLDPVPTPKEFQDIYDFWRDIIEGIYEGRAGHTQKSR